MRPINLLFALILASAPVVARANPTARPAAAQTEKAARPRKPASSAELERYAEREKKDGKKLERFEGGRWTETTIIIVLLLVIVIIILV